MRAAITRNYARIEVPVKGPKSSTGASTVTWNLFCNAWIGIETFKGYERQAAQAAWPGADCKIIMRYIPGLLPTMRIVFEDKIYSILGSPIDLDNRHREIEINCQTGVKGA